MKRSDHVQICELLELLEKKLDVFKSFLSATAQLKDAANLQKMEKIEPFVAKRENCIKVIGEIDGRINRIRNFIPALPGGAVERVRAITKAIDDTVAAAHLNKEFETMFIFHHNNLKDRLSKTRHSRDGIKNYALGAYGENQPRFLDVKL